MPALLIHQACSTSTTILQLAALAYLSSDEGGYMTGAVMNMLSGLYLFVF